MNLGRGTALVLVGACALLSLPTADAHAQSSSEVAAARRLFSEGLDAARRGDWPAARERFERSFEIAPRMSTLVNLAGAQAETGQLVAAAESYRRYLSEATTGRDARYRDQAERALAAIEPRLVQLTIHIDGLLPDDVVTLGERELRHAVLGVALPVDPGHADLVVTRDGSVVAREPLVLEEGDDLTVSLRVRAAGQPVSSTTSGTSDVEAPAEAFRTNSVDRDAGGDDTPLIIGIIAGVAVAIAVGVTIGVVVANDSSSPQPGSFGGGIVEFD